MRSSNIFIASLIGTGVLAGLFAIDVAKKATDASKMFFDIQQFKIQKLIKGGLLPSGVIYQLKVLITNPSNSEIEFTSPFITLYYPHKGEMKRIANTNNDTQKLIRIGANSKKEMVLDFEMRFANIISITPDIATYIANRYLKGYKATRAVVVNVKTSAKGQILSFSKKQLL